ncbi:MAG: hypothetical protein ABJN84_08005 [Flavobacteriaceae bacterium]
MKHRINDESLIKKLTFSKPNKPGNLWNHVLLSIKIAQDTILYYNVPKILCCEKNLTEGTEEHVFTINDSKEQKWVGFYNN